MSDNRPAKASLAWCRLYSNEFLLDPKFTRIQINTGESLTLIRGVYATLLALAGANPERNGELLLGDGLPLSHAEILQYLDLDAEVADPILDWMARLKIIRRRKKGPWVLINFEKRNPWSDASPAYRMKRHREKKRGEGQAPEASPHHTDLAKDKQRGAKPNTGPDQNHSNTVAQIEQHFTQQAGFFPPADPNLYREYWGDPIAGWLKLANAELVKDWVTQAIHYNRGRNYAYTQPSSIDRRVRDIASQADVKESWREIQRFILERGSKNPPNNLDPIQAQVVEALGGWDILCKMKRSVAWDKFAQAYYKVVHEQSDTGISRS